MRNIQFSIKHLSAYKYKSVVFLLHTHFIFRNVSTFLLSKNKNMFTKYEFCESNFDRVINSPVIIITWLTRNKIQNCVFNDK